MTIRIPLRHPDTLLCIPPSIPAKIPSPVNPVPERIALKLREAASAIGISESTMKKWMKEGKIPFCRIGGRVLFPVESLRAFVMENVKTGSMT